MSFEQCDCLLAPFHDVQRRHIRLFRHHISKVSQPEPERHDPSRRLLNRRPHCLYLARFHRHPFTPVLLDRRIREPLPEKADLRHLRKVFVNVNVVADEGFVWPVVVMCEFPMSCGGVWKFYVFKIGIVPIFPDLKAMHCVMEVFVYCRVVFRYPAESCHECCIQDFLR